MKHVIPALLFASCTLLFPSAGHGYPSLTAAAVWFWKPPPLCGDPAPAAQGRTDTVFVEKIVWKIPAGAVKKASPRPAPAPLAAQTERKTPALPEPTLPAGNFDAPAAGNPLGNEPELIDFFVQLK